MFGVHVAVLVTTQSLIFNIIKKTAWNKYPPFFGSFVFYPVVLTNDDVKFIPQFND